MNQDGGDGGQEGVDLVFPPLPPRPQVQVILIDWVINANTDSGRDRYGRTRRLLLVVLTLVIIHAHIYPILLTTLPLKDLVYNR